jgi:hypothetical protein
MTIFTNSMIVAIAIAIFGCGCRRPTQSPAVSHEQVLSLATGVCQDTMGWADAYADPNLVVFENHFLIRVFPNKATAMEAVQHPDSALVKLTLDGRLVAVLSE